MEDRGWIFAIGNCYLLPSCGGMAGTWQVGNLPYLDESIPHGLDRLLLERGADV